MRFSILFTSLFIILACKKAELKTMDTTEIPTNANSGQYSYLALGDSYTIGESVEQSKNFPYQLVAQLKTNEISVKNPVIIAKTGWTTSELQTAIKSAALKQQFDIVTLLIGVNNQYRGESKETYRKEFHELLQTAIGFAAKGSSRVFVVSIPDWGVTPFGKDSGRGVENIAKEIDAFNAINKEETLKAGVSYTDITPASRQALNDQTLVAADGLHPSSKMYLDWALNVSKPIISSVK